MLRPTVPLTTAAGAPLLCELNIRPSAALPARLKVTFVASTENGLAALTPDGVKGITHEPVTQAKVALCDEFRLEMN